MRRALAVLVVPVLWAACSGGSPTAPPASAGGRAGATTVGGSAGRVAAGTSGVNVGGRGGASTTPSAGSPSMTPEGGTDGSAGGVGGASGAIGGREGGGAAGASMAPGALGPYPFTPSKVTRGGTMTFTNVGAAGWWPRRIDRSPGDAACDYKDGTDTWGGHCCMKRQETASTRLAPFDEEMTLILKAIDVKQLAIYQSSAVEGGYERVTSWDRRTSVAENLWFTQKGDGSAQFPGDLTQNDCVGYVMQAPRFACGDGRDYYCPDDPGVLHRGFSGSKLVVFLGSMTFDDAAVKKCDGEGAGHPGPWVAFVASELVRDGGRKWNGACNCYSKTGSVGDGCGEINVFEVVMDDNDFSNREFASTGVRSFQAGHMGGSVCQASCRRDAFADDADVVDACAKTAYERGPTLEAGGDTDGCPVWRRPEGDRYFFILLDQKARAIQVGIVHPANIPTPLAPLLPDLPSSLSRASVDGIVELRLPE